MIDNQMQCSLSYLCTLEGIICGITADDCGTVFCTTSKKTVWKITKNQIDPQRETLSLIRLAEKLPPAPLVHNNNTLYSPDADKHRIRSYLLSSNQSPTGMCSTLAGNGDPGHRDAPRKTSQFFKPCAIAKDKNGDLYIAEQHHVRKINMAAQAVETIAGGPSPGNINGEGKKAKFNNPSGIAVASDGTIYVVDQQKQCIRSIINGNVSTLVGCKQKGNQDGSFEEARFSSISAIASCMDGTLLVVDNNKLRHVNIYDHTVNTLEVLTKENEQLNSRHYVAVGDNGMVYVADENRLWTLQMLSNYPTHSITNQNEVPVSGLRLEQLLDKSSSRLERLCQVLDVPKYWKKMAEILEYDSFSVSRMEEMHKNKMEFSPSKQIITEWQHSKAATVERFLEILILIDNETAKNDIIQWKNELKQQTVVPIIQTSSGNTKTHRRISLPPQPTNVNVVGPKSKRLSVSPESITSNSNSPKYQRKQHYNTVNGKPKAPRKEVACVFQKSTDAVASSPQKPVELDSQITTKTPNHNMPVQLPPTASASQNSIGSVSASPQKSVELDSTPDRSIPIRLSPMAVANDSMTHTNTEPSLLLPGKQPTAEAPNRKPQEVVCSTDSSPAVPYAPKAADRNVPAFLPATKKKKKCCGSSNSEITSGRASPAVKIVVVGESASGKTSILSKYFENEFGKTKVTSGFDFHFKNVQVDGKDIKLQCFDTAGFRSLAPNYLHGANVALVVFDLTSPAAKFWVVQVEEICGGNVMIFFVGAKKDLANNIQTEEYKKEAAKHNATYVDCSAKTGEGIAGLFYEIAKRFAPKFDERLVEANSTIKL